MRALTSSPYPPGTSIYGHARDSGHHWATQAARSGTPIDRLQDAGGWASVAMPLRYVEAARIANEGGPWGAEHGARIPGDLAKG